MKLSTRSQLPAAETPRPTPAMLEAAYQQLMAFRELPYLSELTLSLLHKFNNVITGVVFLTEDGMSNTKPGDPVYERLEEIALTLRTSLDSIQQVTRLHLNEQQDDTSFYALEGIIDDEPAPAHPVAPEEYEGELFPWQRTDAGLRQPPGDRGNPDARRGKCRRIPFQARRDHLDLDSKTR
ncbi:MAG: hypothetical protein QM796_12980 [Chthoniobacteraceae bacterium]